MQTVAYKLDTESDLDPLLEHIGRQGMSFLAKLPMGRWNFIFGAQKLQDAL